MKNFLKFLSNLFGKNNNNNNNNNQQPDIIMPIEKYVGEINKDISGLNTGFSFRDKINEHPEYIKLLKVLNTKTLRFPGGTNGSYYHPDGRGYGVRQNEVLLAPIAINGLLTSDKKEDRNYVYNFIDVCKNSHSDCKIILDLNLYTGSVEEADMLISIIESNGLKVYGVELGNELYFQPYRRKIKDVHEYIKICKVYVNMLKNKYPHIKISVVVGNLMEFDTSDGRVNNSFKVWNEPLSKENFYDAISVHSYIGRENGSNPCSNMINRDFKGAYECYKDIFSALKNNPIGKLASEAQKLFKNKPIWFTEWNCGKPANNLTNTIIHGMFTLETLLNFNENSNVIELAHFHNISSVGPAYGTMFLNNRVNFNLNNNKDITASLSYYAFKFYNQCNGKLNLQKYNNLPNDVIVKVFEDNKEVNILFINKQDTDFDLNENIHNNIEYVQGSNLYSSGGRGAISTNFNKMYNEASLYNKNIKKIMLPKMSFGIIKYTKK